MLAYFDIFMKPLMLVFSYPSCRTAVQAVSMRFFCTDVESG